MLLIRRIRSLARSLRMLSYFHPFQEVSKDSYVILSKYLFDILLLKKSVNICNGVCRYDHQ